MMSPIVSPILSLRAAVRTALILDPTLCGLLGGERVYDEVPAVATVPYVTFGEASAKDWSAGSDRGHEHAFSLMVWSRQGGDAEALGIASWIAGLLDGAQVSIEGHRLILMRVTAQDIARPTKDGVRRANVRLQAFTEPVI